MRPRKRYRAPVQLAKPTWERSETTYDVVLPIKILSRNQTSGGKENGFARSKRRKAERTITAIIMRAGQWLPWHKLRGDERFRVVISRMAPRLLDDDNPDVKSVRDAVAEWLGVNDGAARISFTTGQEKTTHNTYGCRVRIELAA